MTKAVNRITLYAVLDAYLAALAAKNPARVEWAKDVRTSENNVMIPVGEGLWGTITGLGTYQLRFADLLSGEVGYFGTVHEPLEESAFSLRLRVNAAGKITEAETIVGANQTAG
jgi:hypothetical protein